MALSLPPMTPKQKVKASKFLSLVLRHKPELIGITVDSEGWANTSDVLAGMKQQFAGMTHHVLCEIVAEDDKQRYALSDHGSRIRASQGHSLPIDLKLAVIAPPEQLYHGTARKTLGLIYRDGLRPMSRQYVHLSSDSATAVKVGKRHGEPVVLTVRSGEMAQSGFEFFRSENGVWLTSHVPLAFLSFDAHGA